MEGTKQIIRLDFVEYHTERIFKKPRRKPVLLKECSRNSNKDVSKISSEDDCWERKKLRLAEMEENRPTRILFKKKRSWLQNCKKLYLASKCVFDHRKN